MAMKVKYDPILGAFREDDSGSGGGGGGNITKVSQLENDANYQNQQQVSSAITVAVSPLATKTDLAAKMNQSSNSGVAGQVLTKTAGGHEWKTPSGGGGAVSSVNGQTGAVTLNGDNLDMSQTVTAIGGTSAATIRPGTASRWSPSGNATLTAEGFSTGRQESAIVYITPAAETNLSWAGVTLVDTVTPEKENMVVLNNNGTAVKAYVVEVEA